MKFVTTLLSLLLFAIPFYGQDNIQKGDTSKMPAPTSMYQLEKIFGKKQTNDGAEPQTVKKDSSESTDEVFFDQLFRLPEFKQARKRIDSLRKETKADIKLHIDYIESPYTNNANESQFSITTIYEKHPGGASKRLYTILFDKHKKQISSIEDHIRNTKKVGNLKLDLKALSEMQ